MKRNLVPCGSAGHSVVAPHSSSAFVFWHTLGNVVAEEKATVAARSAGAPEKLLPPEELAAWIDGQFDAAWKEQGLEPAPLTNDSEFVRRAFLNLIGRIPSVAETRAFLEDARPAKRHRTCRRTSAARGVRGASGQYLARSSSGRRHGARRPRVGPCAGNVAEAPVFGEHALRSARRRAPHRRRSIEIRRALPARWRFIRRRNSSPNNWPRTPRGSFWECRCSAPSATIIPSPNGSSRNSGRSPRSSITSTPRADGATAIAADDLEEIRIPGKDVLVPALFLDGTKPDEAAGSRQADGPRPLDHRPAESVFRQGRSQPRVVELFRARLRATG